MLRAQSLSRVQFFATPWTVAHQAPLSMEILQARILDLEAASFPGSGRSPEEENGNPLQYSCLENPMDQAAWFWPEGHKETDMTEAT